MNHLFEDRPSILNKSMDFYKSEIDNYLSSKYPEIKITFSENSFFNKSIVDLAVKEFENQLPVRINILQPSVEKAYCSNTLISSDVLNENYLTITKKDHSLDIIPLKSFSIEGELTELKQPGRCKKPFYGLKQEAFIWNINHWVDLLIVNLICQSNHSQSLENSKTNHISDSCQIHKSSVIENCVLEDNVTVGPFCYLKNSTIGKNSNLQEYSSVINSTVGESNFIQNSAQVRGSVTGDYTTVSFQVALRSTVLLGHSTISAPNVVKSVVGKNCFLGRHTSILASHLEEKDVAVLENNKKAKTNMNLLGVAIGDGARLGSITLAPGSEVPMGAFITSSNAANLSNRELESGKTHIYDNGKIRKVMF